MGDGDGEAEDAVLAVRVRDRDVAVEKGLARDDVLREYVEVEEAWLALRRVLGRDDAAWRRLRDDLGACGWSVRSIWSVLVKQSYLLAGRIWRRICLESSCWFTLDHDERTRWCSLVIIAYMIICEFTLSSSVYFNE